jgi:hypothetical protein
MSLFENDDNKLPNSQNHDFRTNLLILMTEMLHHVATKIWDSFFYRFWILYKDLVLETSFRNREYAEFTYIGLSYSSCTEIFILDILRKIDDVNYKDEHGVLQKLMSRIKNNVNFKNSVQIDDLYNNLMIKERKGSQNIWTISSYLFEILSVSSKKKLKKLILIADFEKSMSDHFFYDIVYKFSKKDKNLKDQIERIVFTSKRLWDVGYTIKNGKYRHSGTSETLFYLDYFNLQLETLISHKSPIINSLYGSLSETYNLMNKTSTHRLLLFNRNGTQLRNIIFFLNKLKKHAYEAMGVSTAEIDIQLDNFQKLATIPISQQDIRKELSSNEKEAFNKAMEALDYELLQLKCNVVDFELEINLIIGRLFSIDDTFESGLGYITNWSLYKRREFIPLFKVPLLLLIEKHIDFEKLPKDLDKIYVIQHLTIISVVLQNEIRGKEEIVDLFIEKSKKLNFNIIKAAISDVTRIIKKEG